MESNSSLPLIDQNTPNLRQINPRSITFRGKQIKLRLNPIFRYNYFITCYNFESNKVNFITLSMLPRNRIYYFCYPLLQPKYLLVHLIFDFIPYLNLIWLIFLIFMWIIYERARVVFNANKKLVKNPLSKMHFEPEICLRYRCMNKFLEIPRTSTTVNGEREERVTVMVYNQNFKKIFTQFPMFRYLHVFHITISTLIIIMCYVWVYHALSIDKSTRFGH
jgi:hypothetical protein